jgi:hypothetical protein
MKIDDMEAWRRLGRAVARRRTELRMTQSDVSAHGGPSLATMQAIEAARQDSYRDRTLADLEQALGWQRGSVESVLFSGGDPVVESTERPAIADARRVGGRGEDAGFVTHRHDPRPSSYTDEEVLALIDENRRLADELERRIRGGE